MKTFRKTRAVADDLLHVVDIEMDQGRTVCGDATYVDLRQVFDDKRAIGCRECRTAVTDWLLGL